MTEVLRYAAFTQTPDGGNPAGVVLQADDMSDDAMQRVAADVGYSETAFASAAVGERRHRLRYFSPLAEVAFCGHATIATAVVLAERYGPGPLLFETPAGDIEVETRRQPEGILASLRSVPTHSRPATDDELTKTLEALGWKEADLQAGYPPHVAFAGNEHLVLGVKTRERLADLVYDFDALRALMLERNWTTVQLFWVEDDTTVHARDPFPVGGVVEDPATGAAAAALGGYFRDLGMGGEMDAFTIRQGEDMGRPSELSVQVEPQGRRVTVSGYAVPIQR